MCDDAKPCVAERDKPGEVSEWLKEHAWKVCILERVSRVRISYSPQFDLLPRLSRGIFVIGFFKAIGKKPLHYFIALFSA